MDNDAVPLTETVNSMQCHLYIFRIYVMPSSQICFVLFLVYIDMKTVASTYKIPSFLYMLGQLKQVRGQKVLQHSNLHKAT